jgi:hypothetical protein
MSYPFTLCGHLSRPWVLLQLHGPVEQFGAAYEMFNGRLDYGMFGVNPRGTTGG